MRTSVRSSMISRLAGAVAALWLSGVGSAWAGGSADAGALQAALGKPDGTSGLCAALHMTSCPQLPTITQLVLEIAALANATPEMVRYANSVPQTAAVNAVNPPAGFPVVGLADVSVPLAFISDGATVVVTDLNDDSANSFFYAATNGVSGLSPDTLYLFYEYLPLTNQSFAKGQFIADITVPLVVYSNGTESPAPTMIQIRGATGCGKTSPCVSTTAIGNFGKGTVARDAADLGIIVTLDFSTGHAIFGVQVKLLVINSPTIDLAYFSNPNDLLYKGATFTGTGKLGFTPKFLGLPVGVAPVAAIYAANIANTSGASVPAVSAYLAIGTDGETLLSAPLP